MKFPLNIPVLISAKSAALDRLAFEHEVYIAGLVWPVSISYNNYNYAAPAIPIYIDTCCHIVGYNFLVLPQVFRIDQINSMLNFLHLIKKISI